MLISVLLMLSTGLGAQNFTYDWDVLPVDGSRTAVTAYDMGHMKGKKFITPDGRKIKKGTAPKVARIMLEAQDAMAEVKEVVGYSTEEMVRRRPESGISNMIIDVMMDYMRDKYGKPVDVGIYNYGGIRVDMPKGNIIRDDIMSMLPFTNSPVWLALKGSEIRSWFEYMAEHSMQVVGGARLVVKDHKLVEATIGGEPIDDNKVYGLVTIDFLLNGGDGLSLARNAKEMITDELLARDVLLQYVKGLTAAGKNVEYKTDGRVVFL